MDIVKKFETLSGSISDKTDGYFFEKPSKPPLLAYVPEDVDDLQECVRVCQENRVHLFTTYDRYFNEDLDMRNGILLDLTGLNNIKNVDDDDLVMLIERCVSYKDIQNRPVNHYTKVFPPLVSSTGFVVQDYVSRIPLRSCSRFSEPAYSNMRVVIKDGIMHKTGEHSISEKAGDGRDDPGPNISRWYSGAYDYLGIVAASWIHQFPVGEKRDVSIVPLKKVEDGIRYLFEIPRLELCQECIILDGDAVRIFIDNNMDYEAVLFIGYEGSEKIVHYQKERVRKMIDRDGFFESGDIAPEILDKIWLTNGKPIFIYSDFNRLNSLLSGLRAVWNTGSRDLMNYCVISSYSRGGCCVVATWAKDKWGKDVAMVRKKVAEKGFFVEKFIDATGKGRGILKLVNIAKSITDPFCIFNPGLY